MNIRSRMLAIWGRLISVFAAIAPWLVVPAGVVIQAGVAHDVRMFAILLFVACMGMATWLFVPPKGGTMMHGMNLAFGIVFSLALLAVAAGMQWTMVDSKGTLIRNFAGNALFLAILGRLAKDQIYRLLALTFATFCVMFSCYVLFFVSPRGQYLIDSTSLFLEGIGGIFGFITLFFPMLVAMKRECAYVGRIFFGNLSAFLLGGVFWAVGHFSGASESLLWPMLPTFIIWLAVLIWACVGEKQ